MSRIQQAMIDLARARYGAISPCGSRKSIAACFTIHQDHLVLWFNDRKGDTHVVMESEVDLRMGVPA